MYNTGLPVDADSGKIEYRRRTAHDVQRHPRITHDVTQLPLSTIHLTGQQQSYHCNTATIKYH